MEKQTQTLMLGDVDIGQYLIKSDISKKQLVFESSFKKLEKAKEDCLPCEKEIYDNVFSKMLSMKYPLLDLSFLEKSSIIDYPMETTKIVRHPQTGYKRKGFFGKREPYTYYVEEEVPIKKNIEIKVPKFCVYPFYGSNKFSIVTSALGAIEINNREKILPIEIESRLLRGLEVLGIYGGSANPEDDHLGGRVYMHDLKSIPWETRKNYSKIEFEHEFKGKIPKETKEKVKEAEKYFDKDQIYLIPETKPEEWKCNIVEMPEILVTGGLADPLVIGRNNNYYHLIDHFDTTPLENLVKDTYIKNKLS